MGSYSTAYQWNMCGCEASSAKLQLQIRHIYYACLQV